MPGLKRSLRLFECTLMGVGVMLGTGIYALVGIGICSAAVAIGFAGYLNATTGVHEIWSAVLPILAASVLLVCGIKQAAWVGVACTVVERLGLAIVIAVGLHRFGSIDYFETAPNGGARIFSGPKRAWSRAIFSRPETVMGIATTLWSGFPASPGEGRDRCRRAWRGGLPRGCRGKLRSPAGHRRDGGRVIGS